MTIADDHALLEQIRLSRVGLTYQPKRHGAPPKGCNPRSWGAGNKPRPVYTSDGRWWFGLMRAGRGLGVSHGRVAQAISEGWRAGEVYVSRHPFDGVQYSTEESTCLGRSTLTAAATRKIRAAG